MIVIDYAQMLETFRKVLLTRGFTDAKAGQCAKVFADNSLDGVYSHGVNRFPKFVEMIDAGYLVANAEPELVSGTGGFEQWNGNLAAGPLNAITCTDRAMQLAGKNGIGCVALANTNHWMRGGSYGWRAAKQGFAFACFTNTIANMPAWGAVDNRLGNNPLVLAVPYQNEAIVLDMAMSQFSYGAMENYTLQGGNLPVAGGYDTTGNLTTDPAEILKSKRTLPIGYWKGAGLSLLLDVLATILAAGNSTAEISSRAVETGLSQVFIAISLAGRCSQVANLIQQIIADFHASKVQGENKVLYPGERVITTRRRNQQNGIPVNETVWQTIVGL